MAESIEFTSLPDNNKVGSWPIVGRVETVEDAGVDVTVTVELLINGSVVETKEGTDASGTPFSVEFEYDFAESGTYSVLLNAIIDYDDEANDIYESVDADVFIRETAAGDVGQVGDVVTYKDAFTGRSDTVIENIITDDDVTLNFTEIDFAPYGNPSVAVDNAGRFAKHDIIGGTTVRQKLGEEPRAIEVSGVCTETIAKRINQLHKAKLCSLNSETVGEIIRCQIASSSTDPLVDGGAADMDGGEFLYSYNINLIEVSL